MPGTTRRMSTSLQMQQVMDLINKRDIRGLTRAISLVEDHAPGIDTLLNMAFRSSTNGAFTLGFTGAPGAGKSTLVNGVIRRYRRAGKSVGVMAVDPTSAYSGGAVLGDRIRMQEHNADTGVYIRSLASRRALGGLAEAVKYALYLYKAFGFDIIMVETLGIGQDEIDIARYVDVTAVLLVPGYGDSIQMAKAGIMEIADLFIINKADRPGADLLMNQVLNSMQMKPEDDRPPVILTKADRDEGLDDVIEAIELLKSQALSQRNVRYRRRITEEIRSAVFSYLSGAVDEHLDEVVDKVLNASMTPLEASMEVIRRLRKKD